MSRILVSDLKDKDSVMQLFLVQEKHMSLGKNGRPFLSMTLADRTGRIDAKMWDNVEEIAQEFATGDLVQIKGQVQLFQSRKQLIVHRVEKSKEMIADMSEFIAVSHVDSQGLYMELLQFVKSMENQYLKQLTLDTLEDPEIKELFLRSPAAKSIHHAWVGGLIEHVVSITKILSFMAGNYPFLNRDLLIFGGIFHDIGKIWELSSEPGFAYTDRGRLLGHMQLACELIDRKTQRILGFPADLVDLCKHMILSHHGKLEYGSPKTPQFAEALLVAMVDELDSKVSTVHSWISAERVSAEKWSRYNELFERYFLVENLKEKYK